MKRLTAVVTAAASTGLATAALGIGMLPALASAQTAARPVSSTTAHAAQVRIPSQYGSGQYVSVVNCQGGQVPPPVRLRQPNTPLHLTGTAPTPAVTKAMATRGRYKTVYTCTVVVQKQVPAPAGKGGGLKQCELGQGGGTGNGGMGKNGSSACHKPVTLNTGFGGAAGPVAGHHPR
jgi:hypothetical protein